MAKLTRLTGKVFAGSADLEDLGVFGSAKAGTPTNPTGTDTEAQIQAGSAYDEGWTSAIVTSRNFPPIEEVNGVLRTISYQDCYLLQEGIPEYDINTKYSNTSIVKSINNGIITLYTSLANDNIGNALTNTTYWQAHPLDVTLAQVQAADAVLSGQITDIQNALPNKANVALDNVSNTSGFRKLVETYNNGYSWYKVYREYNPSSGDYIGLWCEQGGYVSITTQLTEVDLLKDYADSNYTILLQSRASGNNYSSEVYNTTPPAKDKFIIWVYIAGTGHTMYWKTEGYLDEE